ncbi:MAG TPA: DNA-processing protein DprA [Candidatus Dormibacteraeota bacterium]|nr:DNA-processing protein DprA [Candidatus Dormibacteraeota bacterium]
MSNSPFHLGWLALGLVPGLGPRSAGKLLGAFGDPEGIFRAPLTELESQGLPAALAQAIHSQRALRQAEGELKRVQEIGCRLVTWNDAAYPRLLREIYDPPPLLYIQGNPDVLSRHAVAIVGTRRPTPYGNQMSERLGRDLAEQGLVIASGLARGIDTLAHRGALKAGTGTTVAVVGCGIDVVYPKENKRLFEEIAAGQGAVVTELPTGSPPMPQNFPVRNRIIAGMALGTVVVEGTEHSGSLITARLAMEFGREVYGVPGNASQPNSYGPNHLIKQGAKLVTGWQDVIEELPTAVRAALAPVEPTTAAERASLVIESLSGPQRVLYELLGADESRHIDELVESSNLSSSETLAALLDLEMKGYIRQLPGKQFVKVML